MLVSLYIIALAGAVFDLIGQAAAAPQPAPVCSSKQYSSYLTLSALPTALSYCSANYPLSARTTTTLLAGTTTSQATKNLTAPAPTVTVTSGGWTTVTVSTTT